MQPDPETRWRILFLGPRPREDASVAGPQLAFNRLLARFLERGTFGFDVEDATRPTGRGDPLRRTLDRLLWRLKLCGRVVHAAHRCDLVHLYADARDLIDAGPWVWCVATLCGKPLAVQVASGGLDRQLDRLPAWKRFLVGRTVLHAPLLLLQTRGLCERFEDRLGVRWQPPVRDLFDEPLWVRGTCQRFLFLSTLHPERGVAEALAASDALPEGCTLTVAGPETVNFDPSRVDDHPNARWVGPVAPADVPELMRRHDALVFPSWRTDDGLPGVVVEAMQCGLPVVAAAAGAIDELVVDGGSGLLVHPRATGELADALRRLVDDPELFVRLASGARTLGEQFRSARWHDQHEDWLFQLCDQGVLSRTLPFYEREEALARRSA